MEAGVGMPSSGLSERRKELLKEYEGYKSQGLKLDMSEENRG